MRVETLKLRAHRRSYRMQWPLQGEKDQAGGKIAACVRAGRPYEQVLLEHIYGLGLEGCAVDVGANIGNHALWFGVVCGLDVIAFEPIVEAQLRTNVALNGLEDRIRVEAVALGASNGTARSLGRGRLSTTAALDEGHSVVTVRTLDSFELSRVSMIKIDVEGMEPAVLVGGEQTIRRDRPVIFAEEWGDDELDAIGDVLRPWGFTPGELFRDSPNSQAVRKWIP